MKKIFFWGVILLGLGACFFMARNTFWPALAENKQSTVSPNIPNLQEKVGDGLNYFLDKNTHKITYIKNENGKLPLDAGKDLVNPEPIEIADQFWQEYGIYFGLTNPNEELVWHKTNTDELGMSHLRYQQMHNGVPVYGGGVIVHLNEDLSISSANGRICPGDFFGYSGRGF